MWWPTPLPVISDLIGVFGLLLTLFALGWSIIRATQARSAAVQAREAARDAEKALVRHQETVGIEVAIGKVGDLITLYTSNKRHAVPDKLDWLIEFLDRLRHGPHIRNDEDRERVQRYVKSLFDMHRDISGRVFEDPAIRETDVGREAEKRKFDKSHKILSDLRVFLRDIEAAGRQEQNNGAD